MWIAQPVSVLDKRQCTLQLCIHTEEPQNIPPAVIFRGEGNVPASEKAAYDKRVHVYWQTNAWLESELALEWVKNTFAPTVSKDAENVLLLDNLRCQTSEVFHSVCKEAASTFLHALPPDETDKVQPVDQGEGWLIKELMGKELDKYLEKDDNLNKWQSSLSAGDRRILITKWLDEAWEKVSTDCPDYRKKLFLKTGLLMTADGSNDDLIKPEGFEDCTF